MWKPGALIYTGDSHAVQGDGEICLTAIGTSHEGAADQVVLHKRKDLGWPVAETDKHWIVMGLDKDLNPPSFIAARNAIKFLAVQAKISELDAYALCSIAVSFRVTQVVDIVRGVHALIPRTSLPANQATDESGVRQRPNQRRSGALGFQGRDKPCQCRSDLSGLCKPLRTYSPNRSNRVVIAESTRKLLGNLFELEDLGAQDLKGIAGTVRAWAALRASSVESRFEAFHASGLTELVGREEELELLLRRWSKAKTRRRPSGVALG